MSNSINIKFRTKFIKRIQTCSEELQDKLEQSTITFVEDQDNDHCYELLWLMTYDPAEALKFFDLKLDTIPEDLVLPWRDELRYQRTLVRKDFLLTAIPESCKSAYQNLLNVSDVIITTAVYKACFVLCKYASDNCIERSLYLLGNSQEANYFGGIRTLNFNKVQAIVLKKYALQIRDLLEAIWNEHLLRKSSDVNTPMAAPLKKWLQTHSTAMEEEPDISAEPSISAPDFSSENARSDSTKKSSITVMNIMANEALFEKFLSVCQELEEAGYNCEEVVCKLDAISNVLDASKMLDR